MKQQRVFLKSERFWKAFYGITLLLGLILLYFEILIYRKTIISIYIPVSIVVVCGLTAFLLNKQHYNKVYWRRGNFLPLIQNLGSWGCIACYIFMAINYYPTDKASSEYKFVIEEKSSLPGPKRNRNEKEPTAKINYFGFEKELVFKHVDFEKVNKSDSVIVIVRKGGLGFDVLESFDVLEAI